MVPSLSSITSRLRFRQLSMLVALEKHGSLHKAAERLGMTQPGLTKSLREIESTFGTELFTRTPKGVQPNELGLCIIRYARLIDSDLGRLREEIDGVLRGGGGRVAVGSIAGAIHSVLIGALSELRYMQPALSIDIRESISSELLNQVNEGRLDLAICRTTVSSQADQFDYEPLMDEVVAVAAGPRHALANVQSVDLAQLSDSRWILYPGNMPLRQLLEREFKEAGLPLPSYPIETASSLATMLLLNEDSQVVALMATGTMEFCVAHRIAVRLPITIKARHEGYGIVTRRGTHLSPAAHMLIKCLRNAAQAQQPAHER